MSKTAAPEQRTATVDVADVRTEGKTLRGFAALYGVESRDLGGFTETIERGAFADVLASDPDVYLTFNHSPDRVLARTTSGTLRLRDEERGLAFEADLGDGPTAQDVREMVKRGDVSGASFRFIVDDETWEGDRRSVTKIAELIDLSLATTPAYDGPTVELRSKPDRTSTTAPDGEQKVNNTMSEQVEGRTDAPEDAEERREVPKVEDVAEPVTEARLKVEDRVAEDKPISVRVVEEMRSVNVGEVRALSTSSASAIAPPELSNFLFESLRPSSVALQSGVTVVATDRESIKWPKLTTAVQPDFYSEGGTITPGDPTFVELEATPQKIAHITVASNEVIDDSDPSVVEVLNSHLAQQLGLKLDRAIYTGGTAVPGVTGLTAVDGTQTGGTITASGEATNGYDPVINAVGQLRSANAPEPYVMVAHPDVYTALGVLKNGTLDEQLSPPREYPATFASTQIDTDEAYVYSPSQLVLVRRQDVSIELDRSRLFNSDQSEIRGKLRADLLVPNPEAVVVLTAT